MRLRFSYFVLIAAVPVLFSCNEERKTGSGGPIVLGDRSTIVTETDSQYLRDMVPEYQPAKPVDAPAADTTAQSVATPDTTAVAPQEPIVSKTAPAEPEETPVPPKGKGLTIDLKEVDIFIPDVAASGSGGSYTLKSGSLNGRQVTVSGATVQRFSQRYQSTVVAKNNLGTLVLDNLGTTSGWQPLHGNGKSFTISGLDAGRLNTAKVTPATIQNAVTRAAKRSRISKSAQQKWIASVGNVRSANQKPLSVKLRSVMWKIDGKDAKGRPFSKQVRIDMPL